MTAQPDTAAPTLLPAPATTRRTFSQADTLTVFAEIYDNSSRPSTGSGRQIDVAVALLSESGQEAFNARDTIGNNPSDRWTAYGFAREIPLRTLAPGRYLLRLEAKARDNSATALRETLITVR